MKKINRVHKQRAGHRSCSSRLEAKFLNKVVQFSSHNGHPIQGGGRVTKVKTGHVQIKGEWVDVTSLRMNAVTGTDNA